MFIIKLNKSCFITYLGIVFGVLSASFAFSKIAFSETSFMRYSLVFLVLSGICDMFDGKIARMCERTKEEKEFGIQLDSLADTFNFLAVPVIIMLSLNMHSVFDILAFMLLILCGVARLAYFNVHAKLDEPVKFYKGLPVTSTAIIYPVLGLVHGVIDESLFIKMYLIVTYLIAFLFVFNFKCPKLKETAYIIVPILAVLLIALLLFI